MINMYPIITAKQDADKSLIRDVFILLNCTKDTLYETNKEMY